MALTAEQRVKLQAEFDRQLKEESRRLVEVSSENLPQTMREEVEDTRKRGGRPPEYTGLDHSGYLSTSDGVDDATIRAYNCNSYLSPALRGRLEALTLEAATRFREGIAEKTVAVSANMLMEEYEKELAAEGVSDARKEELRYMTALARRTGGKAEIAAGEHRIWLTMSEEIAHFLAGDVAPDKVQDGPREFALRELGLDVSSPEIDAEKRVLGAPKGIEFVCEESFAVDRQAFTDKLSSGVPYKAAGITSDELDYGVATFDRAMNGLYGRGGRDLNPSDPMYLGKFDHIFFDGKSVSSLCGAALEGIADPRVRSDYMKTFTTALAIKREARMECAVPEVTLVERDGKMLREFAPMDKEHPQIIPAVAKVQEQPQKVSWIKRVLAKVGLYKIQNLEADYKQMLETDENQAERHAGMAESIDSAVAQKLRDEVQMLAVSQSEPIKEDVFFKVGDLGEINEFCDEDFFAPEEIHGIATLQTPQRRTNMAMLYMFSQGHSLDVILSDDPAHNEVKAQSGAAFYKILHEGTEEQIAQCYADMAQALIDARIPEIDYTNDRGLAAYQREGSFLRGAYKDLTQSISHADSINEMFIEKLGPEGEKMLEGVDTYTAALTVCTRGRMPYVKSAPEYSEAAANPGDRMDVNLAFNAVAVDEPLRQMNRLFGGVGGRTFREVAISRDIRNGFEIYVAEGVSTGIFSAVSEDASKNSAELYALLNRTGTGSPYSALERQTLEASGLAAIEPVRQREAPAAEAVAEAADKTPEAEREEVSFDALESMHVTRQEAPRTSEHAAPVVSMDGPAMK